MIADEFIVFGRIIGSQDAIANVKLTGIDYDGTIHGETNSGQTVSFRGNQLSQLRDDDLVMSKSDKQASNSDLYSALEDLGNKAGGASVSDSIADDVDESMRRLFQAVVKSARQS